MQLPLRLQLKASRHHLVFLASGHILAGVAVCFLRIPSWWSTCILVLLVGSFWLGCKRARVPLPQLLLRADGKLELHYAEAPSVLVEVDPDTLVWPWLVILHLRAESGRMRPLVLFADSAPDLDKYRQLRIWLRWRAESAESA